MENEQKKTDFQILYEFLIEHGFWEGSLSPFSMIKESIPFFEQILKSTAPISTKVFLDKTYALAQSKCNPVPITYESYYSFVIAIYILLKAEGPKNNYQRDFIYDLEKILQMEERAHFDMEQINKVVQQIKDFRLTAPKFHSPMDEFDEIAKGKKLNDVDWPHLLEQMLRFAGISQTNYPYFITLHTFLLVIPDPMLRVDVLGELKTVAPQCLDEKQAKHFIADANMLIPTYMRLRILMINHPLPTVWTSDSDLNEFVLLMNDITPEELVALSQVIIDYRRHNYAREGIVAHILRIPLYTDKIITESGLEFCQGLYNAIGDQQWVLSGVGEDYFEMPTLDTQNIKYMDKCYDIFLNHRVKQLRDAHIREHQKDKALSLYYSDILAALNDEFKVNFEEEHFRLDNPKAYKSLKARFEDLIAYTIDLYNTIDQKEENQRPACNVETFRFIISDDQKTLQEIQTRIALVLNSPAKLRDELYELHKEKLIRIPLNNPTDIIREVRRIWGKQAPAERSFVTTWGRLKTK